MSQKAASTGQMLLIIGAGAIAVIFFASIFIEPSAPNPASEKYYHARAAIQKNLKSPSSAKFSNPQTDKNTGAKSLGGGVWHAFGFVESQNSFGAMLGERWELVWKDPGGKILYMKIGSQKTGDREAALKAGAE